MRKREGLKSPVRENCTPGSVRGPSGNWRSYRDGRERILNQQRGNIRVSMIMKHKIQEVKSWNEFKTMMTNTHFPHSLFIRGVFLFRGHGSPKWPLMSSFDRWYSGGSKRNKVKVAERLISLFTKEAE